MPKGWYGYVLIGAIGLCMACSSQKKTMQRVTEMLEIRQKAYQTLDCNLMMSTYHPEYRDRETNYEARQLQFTRMFKPGQNYRYTFSNIRVSKKKDRFHVTYDYLLEKNMEQDKRGFSMNNRDQEMIVVDYQDRLVEYGRR